MSGPNRPTDWVVLGPGVEYLGKTRGVKQMRADVDFAEQLVEASAPYTRCNSHAEEWDGRVNRCVLNDDHLDYHTDGCLQWSDATACEGPERSEGRAS